MAAPAPAPAPGMGGFSGAMPAMPNPAAGIVTNPIDPNGGMLGNAFRAAESYPMMQQQAQEAKLKLQQQQATYANQQLQMMSQYISSNPNYASNPQVAQRVAQLSQQVGIPPPLTADGKIDVEALGASTKPDFNKLTPEQQAAFAEMPTDVRQAQLKNYRNVPPDVLNAKQYMTQATVRSQAADATHLLTSGNVSDINSAYAIIRSTVASGSADPADLKDASQAAQTRWQQTFDEKKAMLGETHIKDEQMNAWHEQSVALDTAKLDATVANDQGKLQLAQRNIDLSSQRLALEAQRTQSFIATSTAKTNAYVQNMQAKTANSSVLTQAYKGLTTQRTALEATKAKLATALLSASSEADKSAAQAQLNQLNAQEATIDVAIQSYGAAYDKSVNNNISTQAGGKSVTTVGGAGATADSNLSQYGQVTGHSTYKGKSYVQYADGTIRDTNGKLVDSDGNPQ